ncbi:choice-of-anchor M domain-containing protein [Corynebacterium sp. HS2168-gen11]|uniref:choice-of-anchor M domain-containing protein n=1 Tax=Corynebacterium sp. HS2168-gen11 TaxID=2974027 RepID=UPI00216B4491|nr:choice-of-anchor M domain-containing protein [Corynebacterium sp. HS2168-gen11]MCS4535012.1 choice-of-anchor M domain-containing protein [Corynebacterium sp. HS2168-gen11]
MSVRTYIGAVLCAAALQTMVMPVPAFAGDLQQTVSADEPVAPAGQLHEFRQGHADLGPLIVSGGDQAFDAFVRDDSQIPPIWRHTDDLLFVVGEQAAQQLPDSDEFAFTGAQPGQKVWVVPQVEQAGVPWLGWSTQSPAFVEQVDRGITMTFVGHSGPGQFTLFLQNGGFEKPQVLWNSAEQRAQELWVDANTHTHANWVFTEPGIHQVAIEIAAKLKDGSEDTITKILTFAVGEEADLPAAQAAQWDGTFYPAETEAQAPAVAQGIGSWVIPSLVAVVGAVVAIALVISVRRRAGRKGH